MEPIDIHFGSWKLINKLPAGSASSFLPRCAYRGTVELSVYVDEKFRRRGVGRRLLEEALRRAPSLEITAFVGLIFAHNEPSLKLFERFGFSALGIVPRVARLDGVERDLTIMGRHVSSVAMCRSGKLSCQASS